MPTYEYLCENCGDRFEEFQSMSASPLKKCKKCSKMKLRRLIGTGAGIIFKGTGFYETDYRSDSYKKAANTEKTSVPASCDSKCDSCTKNTDKKAGKKKTA